MTLVIFGIFVVWLLYICQGVTLWGGPAAPAAKAVVAPAVMAPEPMSKDEVGAARVFAIFGALVPLFIGMIWVFDPVVDIMGLKPKGDGGHFFIEGWVPGWPLLWLGVKLLVYGVAGPGEQELAKKVLLGIFMFSLPAALGVLMLAGGLITIVFAGKIGVASKTVLTVVAWVIVGSALAYATRWMRVS